MTEPEDISSSSPPPNELKRKRADPSAPELEIDLTIPEPPSKKALRKAKKAKLRAETAPTKSTDDTSTTNGATTEPTATAQDQPPAKSYHGIWIGNLPFTADKPAILSFLTTKAGIPAEDITRINLPPPPKATTASQRFHKPVNKGFAYVDVLSAIDVAKAIAVSEVLLEGRRLLIKDAKSFEGRPKAGEGGSRDAVKRTSGKPPSRRVWIGNLGFEVTKEDVERFYGKCGEVEGVHLATFEDSGKCKGFGWVTFTEIEAAEHAVRGWTLVSGDGKADDQDSDLDNADEAASSDEQASEQSDDSSLIDIELEEPAENPTEKPATKPRKWFVNRMRGREIRCEFAEDSTTRYKKRFGKQDGGDKPERRSSPEYAPMETHGRPHGQPQGQPQERQQREVREPSRRRNQERKNAAREKQADLSHLSTAKSRGVIKAGQGTRVTFDE